MTGLDALMWIATLLTLGGWVGVARGAPVPGLMFGCAGSQLWCWAGVLLCVPQIAFVNFAFAWVQLYGLYRHYRADFCQGDRP